MTAARVGARSVVTSSGSSWTASIRTKNLASKQISRHQPPASLVPGRGRRLSDLAFAQEG